MMERSYNDKVFAYLIYDLVEDESREIRLLASPPTRQKFVDTVIMFIQCKFDVHYGFVLEMNKAHTEIRKYKLYMPNEKVKVEESD